jgi:glycosyltransferase involved in cell wall biosynthesis
MKLVMINDCAFVGEVLLKYMPQDIQKQHIKRTRDLWSKTFGISYKILKAKGNVYHAHYLLQDCYVASRLGKKPLVGHAHGSDLRTSLNHSVWRRIVKHNLKNCDKLLVSTPDILGIARQFREDSEYLPNTVDNELFHPKPMPEHEGQKKVLIASDSNWSVKGTDTAIRALSKIRDQVDVSIIGYGTDFAQTLDLAASLGLHLKVLPKVPHEKLNEYYWNADAVIDRFNMGSLGVVSLEAIACGRPAIAYVASELEGNNGFPFKNIRTEEEIAQAIADADETFWKKEHEYFTKEHETKVVVERLLRIYRTLCGD